MDAAYRTVGRGTGMTHIDLLIAFVIGFALGTWVGLVLTCIMAMRGRDGDHAEGTV